MATITDANPVAKTQATHQRGISAARSATVVDGTTELSGEVLVSEVDPQQSIARPSYWSQQNEATSCSMALTDNQQLRMLERLRAAGKQPVTIDELRGPEIDFPAAVISELELNGYAIQRVREHGRLIGVRLLETGAFDRPASRQRHRWRRLSR
jgi:hypothetical protein